MRGKPREQGWLGGCREEHPRVCGENSPSHFAMVGLVGTSPRMRGKLIGERQVRRYLGNIPAHAGKTIIIGHQTCYQQEHPRACGENRGVEKKTPQVEGTSPRMRGKRVDQAHDAPPKRNIPAHAGKTRCAALWTGATQEHPRACGENPATPWPRPQTCGTSPRMRGKPILPPRGSNSTGNIPAHAGKTSCPMLSCSRPREHPRACGENTFLEAASVLYDGTSPRMRGKRAHRTARNYSNRNIPAHAGKTGVSDATAVLQQEHPRACGENDV